MDTQIQQRIIEQIQKASNIGIAVAKNPSIDQMAAALGLYLALKKIGKNAVVGSPTEPIVEVSNLVGIDRVKTTLTSNGGDLIVSFPYREGEIEKVKYTLEEEKGSLNIIVEAGEKGLLFDEKDVKFVRTGKAFDTFFTIGVSQLPEVASLYHAEQLSTATIIAVDNHPQTQQFGTITHVSTQASSVSEQIADILTLMEQSSAVDMDIAQNLLSGIIAATNDFQDTVTTSLAFEMAGILMRKGAIRQRRLQVRDERKHQEAFMSHQLRPQPQQARSQQPRQEFQSSAREQQTLNTHTVTSSVPLHEDVIKAPVTQVEQGTQTPSVEVHSDEQSTINTPAQNMQAEPQKQAPADWLTPKVYKGSSIV